MDAVIPGKHALYAKLLATGIVSGFAAALHFPGEKAVLFGYIGFYVLVALLGVGLLVLAARLTTWDGERAANR